MDYLKKNGKLMGYLLVAAGIALSSFIFHAKTVNSQVEYNAPMLEESALLEEETGWGIPPPPPRP